MDGKSILNSIIGKNNEGNKEYKRGYDDCEKKYKKLEIERNAALNQLRKLGYSLGEAQDPLKDASAIKRVCRERTSCDGCTFKCKDGSCALKGANPTEWMIM